MSLVPSYSQMLSSGHSNFATSITISSIIVIIILKQTLSLHILLFFYTLSVGILSIIIVAIIWNSKLIGPTHCAICEDVQCRWAIMDIWCRNYMYRHGLDISILAACLYTGVYMHTLSTGGRFASRMCCRFWQLLHTVGWSIHPKLSWWTIAPVRTQQEIAVPCRGKFAIWIELKRKTGEFLWHRIANH